MSRSVSLLNRKRSHLLIVDVQEKLLPVISGNDRLAETITFLKQAAALFNVPVTTSEQYPQGLGPTVQQLQQADPVFEKTEFSAADGFVSYRQSERDQVVLCGIEAHICVLQTAFDLSANGTRVFVVADGVGSRKDTDYQTALQRLRDGGVTVCTAESVAFEWCESSANAQFRELSKLVRSR